MTKISRTRAALTAAVLRREVVGGPQDAGKVVGDPLGVTIAGKVGA